MAAGGLNVWQGFRRSPLAVGAAAVALALVADRGRRARG